ncbi:unnamed protein product [Arctogadus glacialis]
MGLTPQLSVQQQSQAAGSGPASSQSVPSWRSSGLGKAGVTSQLSQRLGDAITFHTMHTHTQRNKKSNSPFYSPLWGPGFQYLAAHSVQSGAVETEQHKGLHSLSCLYAHLCRIQFHHMVSL